MSGVNRVFLVGHLGKDPETKFLHSGKSVTTCSLATSEDWKDKQGNRQSLTEWHNLVIWGEHGEVFSKYVFKGSLVHIEGHIKTEKYKGKDGSDRYTTKIVVDRFMFLDAKKSSLGEPKELGKENGFVPESNLPNTTVENNDLDDSDVPF